LTLPQYDNNYTQNQEEDQGEVYMSVKMTGTYLGNKKVDMTHGPSGVSIITDAPKDNHGEGSSFSPTDLFTVSLGSCIITTMAIYAERNGIALSGSTFELEKIMFPDPRRVGAIPLKVRMPAELSKENRETLERVAHTCPVHKSVHPDMQIDIQFVYDIA